MISKRDSPKVNQPINLKFLILKNDTPEEEAKQTPKRRDKISNTDMVLL